MLTIISKHSIPEYLEHSYIEEKSKNTDQVATSLKI